MLDQASVCSVAELAKPFSSIYGNAVLVPQLAVRYMQPAPSRPPGHPQHRPPAPAELEAQVGMGEQVQAPLCRVACSSGSTS